MTASGTFASGREFADFVDLARLGAIVTKGVSFEPWAGNASPRIAETASGMLNSIGLQNPGVEAFCAKDLAWLAEHAPATPVIVNVSGHTADEYARGHRAARDRAGRRAATSSTSRVRTWMPAAWRSALIAWLLRQSCPRAAPSRIGPLIVKLSPNVTDIASIARSVEAAGADAVSLVNTLLGLAIDAESRRPKLARVVGGLSGPAIKPVALRMVWQVAAAVQVPVIGMGGIMDAEDAVEFLLAGATRGGGGDRQLRRPDRHHEGRSTACASGASSTGSPTSTSSWERWRWAGEARRAGCADRRPRHGRIEGGRARMLSSPGTCAG